MSLLTKLFLFAIFPLALIFAPVHALADRLFAGDDWGNNLYEFDTSHGEWSKIIFCDEIRSVNGMNIDNKGNLYASGYSDRAILKFAADGSYSVFAQLDDSPGAAAFDSAGNLFVPYFGSKKVEKWSPDGSTGSIFSTNVAGPEALIFDSHGTLFVADQKSGHIYTFDSDGNRSVFASGLKWIGGILFDRHGMLLVADDHANTIYKYAPDGKRSILSKKVKTPYGLAFDSRENLFVSDGVGKIFEFKNKNGALQNDPVLFAKDLGHDYWIYILPGSMPLKTLISLAPTSWWIWSALAVLLAAGISGFLLIRRKMRRSAREQTASTPA
jgi:hypothetical protein